MTSIIGKDIHELLVQESRVAVSNSNNAIMSATIPDGYKFLCWVGFGVDGTATWASSAYHMYTPTNIRVWLGMNVTGNVIGTYLVYR